MKKFITSAYSRLGRFVVIAVAGCIFSACSDFLDVPLESTVATSNFYKTAEEFDMGLTGVYNMLLSAEWANGDRYGSYFQGFLILGRVGTDEMIIPTNIDLHPFASLHLPNMVCPVSRDTTRLRYHRPSD